MAEKSLKEIIKEEYIKCAKSASYFMKKYCMIQHPTKGKIPFHLYQFQEETLQDFQENDRMVILKSRQLGISTLTAGFSLWTILFHNDKNILVVAIDQNTSKNLVTKVHVMFNSLPSWLKLKAEESNKLSIRLSNGSQIKAIASTGTSGRSEALSLVIIDEAAFVEEAEDLWASLQQTLSTGGKGIILSTPNGTGNFFHKIWTKAESGETKGWKTKRLPWQVHPDRNQAWRVRQDEELGVRLAAQECDCDFSTSGNTVVSPDLIAYYNQNYVKDPIEKRGFDGNLWVWEVPDYSKNYIVSADVARGDSEDYSAFHVIDVVNCTQVAEYKGQLTTKDYGNLLVSVATEYNNALLVVENNNIGWASLQQIIDRDYQNTFYSAADLTVVDVEKTYSNKLNTADKKLIPGFATTSKNRPLIISNLELFFRQKQVIMKSKRLYEELNVFIWNGPKAEAMKGYNDDLVMAIGIGLWVRETALKLRNEQIAYNKAIVSKISKVTSQISIPKQVSAVPDHHKTMDFTVNDKKESLTWLL